MDVDMATVVKAAALNATILEINANWHRLDLKDEHARQAMLAGVDLVINTDAHHTGEYAQMRYGIITARRAGATPDRVLNTFSLSQLRDRIARKRDRKT